jgi:hypothetical protein
MVFPNVAIEQRIIEAAGLRTQHIPMQDGAARMEAAENSDGRALTLPNHLPSHLPERRDPQTHF